MNDFILFSFFSVSNHPPRDAISLDTMSHSVDSLSNFFFPPLCQSNFCLVVLPVLMSLFESGVSLTVRSVSENDSDSLGQSVFLYIYIPSVSHIHCLSLNTWQKTDLLSSCDIRYFKGRGLFFLFKYLIYSHIKE